MIQVEALLRAQESLHRGGGTAAHTVQVMTCRGDK